jgi:hypothetical protein
MQLSRRIIMAFPYEVIYIFRDSVLIDVFHILFHWVTCGYGFHAHRGDGEFIFALFAAANDGLLILPILQQ